MCRAKQSFLVQNCRVQIGDVLQSPPDRFSPGGHRRRADDRHIPHIKIPDSGIGGRFLLLLLVVLATSYCCC